MSNPRTGSILIALACLVALPAGASVMIQRDLPALARAADVVARGTVADTRSELSGDGRRIFTLVTLQVSEVWKGEPPSTLTIRVHGGTHGDIGQIVHGEARFSPGEDVVVFLRRSGDVFRVEGMALGKLAVTRSPDGKELAVPDLRGLEFVERPGDVPTRPAAPQPVQVPELREQVKAAIVP